MSRNPPRGVWPFRLSRRDAVYPRLWDGIQACYAPLLGTTGVLMHDVIGYNTQAATMTGVTVKPDSLFINNGKTTQYRIELPATWTIPNIAGQVSIALDLRMNDTGGDADGRIIAKQADWSGGVNDHDWMLSQNSNERLRLRVVAGSTNNTIISSGNDFHSTAYHRMMICFTYDDPRIRLWVVQPSDDSATRGYPQLLIDQDHTVGGDLSNRSGSDLITSWGAAQSSAGNWASEVNMEVYATYFYNRVLGPDDILGLARLKFFERRSILDIARGSLAAVGGATHEGALTLGGSSGLARVVVATLESARSLGGTAAATNAADAAFAASISEGAAAGASWIPAAVFEAVATFAGIADSPATAAISLEAAATFAGTADLPVAADISLEGPLAVAAVGGLSLASVATLAASLAEGATAGITWGPQANYDALVTWAGQSGVSLSGGFVFESGAALGGTAGYSTVSDFSLEAAFSMAVSSGQSATVAAVFEPAFVQAAIADQAQSAAANMEAEMSVACVAAANMIVSAVTGAGLSLDAVAGVSLVGTVLSASVVPPDGRTYTIALDLRTLTPPVDGRTHTALH